ncbi:hypothetical protein PHLGIDRAFT_117969 [Phlebiopsis gigantea 11061_1 CR5-6]|uniref:Uncharacterized protein n=1 Tax=Phlebiopsis gigantea (strain 11061_1 CR5-6) TaxID=745531 RepID=A0A0C3S8P1_PHLG1|nr:hypothetical protein PHLGIDRAFT_117969 [Phlebiopsis gigantea 11061_1 CR5-6]
MSHEELWLAPSFILMVYLGMAEGTLLAFATSPPPPPPPREFHRIPTPVSIPPTPSHTLPTAQREEEEESSGSESRIPNLGPSRPPPAPPARSVPRAPAARRPLPSPARAGPSDLPRRITHMPERFTEIRAREQEAEAARRSEEQALLQSQQLNVERVYIHTWKENGARAAQTELLDGFKPWPFLLFTPDVLADVGLPSALPGSRRTFQVYNKDLESWFNVKEGYQLQVYSQEHIYIAAAGVTEVPELEAMLAKDKQVQQIQHLRLNLPGQRKAIRRREEELVLTTAVKGVPSRKGKEAVRLPSFQPYPARPSSSRPSAQTQTGPHRPLPLPAPPGSVYEYKASQVVKAEPISATLGVLHDEDDMVIDLSLSPDHHSTPRARRPPLISSPIRIRIPAGQGSQINHPIEIASSDSDQEPQGSDGDDQSDLDGAQTSSSDGCGERALQWPRDWPTYHIVKVFKLCDVASSQRGNSVAKQFASSFPGVPYTASTFYTHRSRWNAASQDTKTKYLALKDQERGKWKYFMREVSDPRAPIGNARKRFAREVQRAVKAEQGCP